ncbi:MAG: arginine--tRNA ligase [Actinobacteria bacterium]|nr:arginine--tRNA ligase [Actinomycetota bacterium]
MIEERLAALVREAVRGSGLQLDWETIPVEPEILRPRQKEHGDFATNIALVLAAHVGRPPRDVASAILGALPVAGDVIERAEVAGPGFLNLFVRGDWLHDALREAVAAGPDHGRAPANGRSVQVEFVSANPTGPLTLGHARNAVIGDALARLFSFDGWGVEREYYFNDAGGQMDRFGASVEARYLQAAGREAQVPQDGYHGAYIGELAADILATEGPALADLPPDERFARLREEGARRVLVWISGTLERFGVSFDRFFHEELLAQRGEIAAAVERLREAGQVYEAEGATWFRASAFGDDKDRVLIRSDGTHTYFAADCAYILDKFGRGFDRLVYVLGADHHGTVARLKGAAAALGHDPEALEIVIYQWVSFQRGGKPVPMSKRAGDFIALDELIDEVGADAARFTLLSSSNDSTMSFDIESVKRQSMDNPVYYVQYAHARIASILRRAEREGVALKPIDEADLSLLDQEAELDLLRAIAELPAEIAAAAELRAPHRLVHAAQDLAARIHRFYTECRVVTDDQASTQSRLWLSTGAKGSLATLLALLGVSAPASMERSDV